MGDLRKEMAARTLWFYETQLRRLNLDGFQELRPDQPGLLIELVSEFQAPRVMPGGFGRPGEPGRVYRDSRRPVWNEDDAARHSSFAATLIGQRADFLAGREPRELAAGLKVLQQEYEASPYGSVTEALGTLAALPRSALEDKRGGAIIRAELAAAKPWLIPELYNTVQAEVKDPLAWLVNLEAYVADFQTELRLSLGATAPTVELDPDAPGPYRQSLASMLAEISTRRAADSVPVRLLELRKDKPEDKEAKYFYELSLATAASAMGRVEDFTLSGRTKYWAKVVHDPLKECVALKLNSDMGQCLLVRLCYRYGTLPADLGTDAALTWRRRKTPDETFTKFLTERGKALGDDVAAQRRLQVAGTKLRIILEESAAHPHSPDPSFSPLAGEILKQGLLSAKFWLDEKPRAKDNDRLNKVKGDLGYGKDADKEMEFWSENHYIMFASSEYLLGQLWAGEIFQPCRLFAAAGDTAGVRTGAQRRDRGRPRVLKWLNNRLMFGWMEFNSSGYYREHLWALLNLVDFALDEEVATKAAMAVDLMLFDVTRLAHRGAMGAAGGRSQFKSKSCGFDNGLTDIVELMTGVKGVFSEADAEIAASLASSTFVVPQVLLEIGANPPSYSFTDRSRVSITFEESGKYGIGWSQHSTVRDSLTAGYASKRARYSPFLAEVNAEIARVHDGYGAREDDTVFFWGMSAFFNKQVVSNTQHVVKKFKLDKCDAFDTLAKLVGLVSILRAPESFLTGFSIADLPERALGALSGEGSDEVDEKTADDLSLVLEGSTRTRANIVTYCSPGATQSSMQNFRYGQLNFQSSIQQVTINGALNVFVNAGFGGLDISDLAAFGAGSLAGGLLGGLLGGPVGAIVGGVGGGAGAVIAAEATRGSNPLNDDHEDGPDWWTGNWALPRVLGHRGAVIMLSEFYDIQDFLAETGSHAWFPKSGFDQVVERRTSAYDDANFALLDIGHIGPKGFWLFGKVVHPAPAGSLEPPEEGYVGVFSNKRPAWLTREDDPYPYRLKERINDKNEGRIRKDAPDPFLDRDWYVNGKNIWIVQVGSRSEFGSFETFMDRVSSARVHADDVGDLECTYDVPVPGGGSDRLRLTNGDSPEFELNGKPLATDLFPRFETPFVRSGVVEWGQRTYCLEWNGASLLHDFSDAHHPVRLEAPRVEPGDADTVVALVLHLRTTDQAMEAYTVLTATVDIGCRRATTDQVAAAGPMAEDTDHDAEWLFFDLRLPRSPDMVLELTHPVSGGNNPDLSFLEPGRAPDLGRLLDPLAGPVGLLAGAGDPEWHGTFSLRALMRDHRLAEATVAFPNLRLEDERRASGKRAFTLQLRRWAPWAAVGGAIEPTAWLLGTHPPAESLWQDHHDLFVRDAQRRVWHRRMSCGGMLGFWCELDTAGTAPDWRAPSSWAAVTDPAGRGCVFVVSDGALLARVGNPDGGWSQPWVDLAPMTLQKLPSLGAVPVSVPLGPGSTVTAVPAASPFDGTADLYVIGSDGNAYFRRGWTPGDTGSWDQLAVGEFAPAPGEQIWVVGRQVVARSTHGELWACDWEQQVLFGGGWLHIDGPGFVVEHVAACGDDSRQFLAVRGPGGRVSVGEWTSGTTVAWTPAGAPDGWAPHARSDLAWAVTGADVQWLIATGADGTVRALTATDPMWTVVGDRAPQVAAVGSRLAATARAPGQVEVFAQNPDGSLAWTWWS